MNSLQQALLKVINELTEFKHQQNHTGGTHGALKLRIKTSPKGKVHQPSGTENGSKGQKKRSYRVLHTNASRYLQQSPKIASATMRSFERISARSPCATMRSFERISAGHFVRPPGHFVRPNGLGGFGQGSGSVGNGNDLFHLLWTSCSILTLVVIEVAA